MGKIIFNNNQKEKLVFSKTLIKKTLLLIIKNHVKKFSQNSSLEFIFLNDEELKQINIDYLNHNYFTDIITFNNADEVDEIDGTIFISVERVVENANTYSVSRENELLRVMFHGVLHLCGLNDKTAPQKRAMRKAEDFYLNLHLQNQI